MRFAVKIERAAKRMLQTLPPKDRLRITDSIIALGLNPDDPDLDTKTLSGPPLWRLRIGRWRVIYDRLDELRVIGIERIGPRGDVYK